MCYIFEKQAFHGYQIWYRDVTEKCPNISAPKKCKKCKKCLLTYSRIHHDLQPSLPCVPALSSSSILFKGWRPHNFPRRKPAKPIKALFAPPPSCSAGIGIYLTLTFLHVQCTFHCISRYFTFTFFLAVYCVGIRIYLTLTFTCAMHISLHFTLFHFHFLSSSVLCKGSLTLPKFIPKNSKRGGGHFQSINWYCKFSFISTAKWCSLLM